MCINSRIQVFKLNKISKVYTYYQIILIVCLSKTLSQFVTDRHTDTKTDKQTGDKHAGRKARSRQTDRQADRHSFGVKVKFVFSNVRNGVFFF